MNEPDDATRSASARTVAVLVENHRRFLAFLERRVGSREVAEDILQDAFVRGLARADQLRGQESIVAWFYRSLRNALVDHWRKVGAERRVFDDGADVADGAEPAVDADLMNAVCTCAMSLLDTLKPEYADALRQVDLGGMSVKTFAQNGRLTANNASVRATRSGDRSNERAAPARHTDASTAAAAAWRADPALISPLPTA